MKAKARCCNDHKLYKNLVCEVRKLLDASGLDSGKGTGWEQYDPLMMELRNIMKLIDVNQQNNNG